MPCYGIYKQQPLTEGEVRATDPALLTQALKDVGLHLSHGTTAGVARIIREQRIQVRVGDNTGQAKIVALRAAYGRLAVEKAAKIAGLRAITTTTQQRQVTRIGR
jgi:hypothetical protein